MRGRERERERDREGGREGEKEREKQGSPKAGLVLTRIGAWTHEL